MALSLANATASAMANGAVDLIDGTNPGKLIIYSGTQPANADTALSGNTPLATFPLNNPAFGDAANGVATLNATGLTVPADNTGTASFFRVYKNDGTTAIFDGAVAVSGAELNLNTVSLNAQVNVTITSGSFTMPTA